MRVQALVFGLVHAVTTLWALVWLSSTRRGGVLAFTHYRDVDVLGKDLQMGPLVESLAREGRLQEISFVPLTPEHFKNLAIKGRLFVSHAVILGVARLLARRGVTVEEARVRVTKFALRLLRPAVVIVIDEAGSGRSLVGAARSLGIPSVGVQHGDFQRGNPQYDPGAVGAHRAEPPDVFATWSDWFTQRLEGLRGDQETRRRTHVTGRLRYPAERPRSGDGLAVLVVAEAAPEFVEMAGPYVRALMEAGATVWVREHPAVSEDRWHVPKAPSGSMADLLAWVHVVVGRASSGLLEASWALRPAVVIGDDRAGYVASAHLDFCDDPRRLFALCSELLGTRGRAAATRTHELVWGGAPQNPLQALKDLLSTLERPLRSKNSDADQRKVG